MAGLRDNREDLYDVNGNYVGQGGQGMVTQPGADPSDGGHAQVVKAGVEKLEADAANLQNGVAQVKGALPGWNHGGNGGRSSLSGAAAVGRKVADIAQANGNTAPAPKAQVTQPSGTTQSGGVLSGAVDAGKKLATIAQQPSTTEPSGGINISTPETRAADTHNTLYGGAAASPGQTARQELRQKQNAEINAENAKKAEEAIKREEADKSLVNGGHQPAVTETQLQTEKNTNPQSSETGNSRDGVTAQNTDADNGGQSVVPSATEVKTESSLNTTKPTVSKEDYDKAQAKLQSDRSKGGIGSLSDKLTVFDYEHPERKEPELPDLEEFTESQPPKLKDIDDSYRTAYAIMEQRMKAAGDDPASKAKRAKARRAQTIVAALGDLLQAAANMWGAAGGATSAKLSSVTAGVAKRHAYEDAAELKREAQRAKDLERMVRRGEKLTEAENKKIMELWKAGENARKYNIGEKNKNLRAKYQSELQAVRAYNAQIGRDRHQVQVQHDREVTDLNRHNYRSSEIQQRTAGSIKVKRTPPAKASDSGKTSGKSQNGTPLNKNQS